MPHPLNPRDYNARYLEHPVGLLREETYGVIVAPYNAVRTGASTPLARMIDFKDKVQWNRYLRDMATKGREWKDFKPIVFQSVGMGVVTQGVSEAEAEVLRESVEIHQPIDSRLEPLTGGD